MGKPVLIKCCSRPCVTHSLRLSVTQATLHEDGSEGPAAPSPPPQKASSEERKQRWEAGQIDYMGDDSFDNIARKLDSFLK